MPYEVAIQSDGTEMLGTLTVPDPARGLVVFAHGSGSSRHSRRNQFVAAALAREGFATLLLDLLTVGEEALDSTTAALRFDVALLARRVERASSWASTQPQLAGLALGYFGASTGAGAALLAASNRSDVRAVVSRGGRPDLAGGALERVAAPTLLLVGSNDPAVIRLNRQALAALNAESQIVIVPGAGHLFEERGTLEAVAQRAAEWFAQHL